MALADSPVNAMEPWEPPHVVGSEGVAEATEGWGFTMTTERAVSAWAQPPREEVTWKVSDTVEEPPFTSVGLAVTPVPEDGVAAAAPVTHQETEAGDGVAEKDREAAEPEHTDGAEFTTSTVGLGLTVSRTTTGAAAQPSSVSMAV